MSICEMCNRNVYHLHFYKTSKTPKFSSFAEAYNQVAKERSEYHYSYGKDGFLSERTSEDYLSESRITAEAERVWDIDQSCSIKLEKVACKNIAELDHIRTLPNFIEFIGEK